MNLRVTRLQFKLFFNVVNFTVLIFMVLISFLGPSSIVNKAFHKFEAFLYVEIGGLADR